MAQTPIGMCPLGVTLTLPKQKIKALAVLIHGSGAIDRDGTIPGGFTTYKDIAEHLSENGIATVRFDKRSSIKTCAIKMNHPKFSYKIFIEDIKNIIRYSQARKELAGLSTVLIGHSQGVNFGSEIAAEKSLKIDGLVLLAGLGKYPIDKTIIRQLKAHLDNKNLPEKTRKQYEKLTAHSESFFEKIRSGNYKERDFFMGAFAPFWSEYISVTEGASLVTKKAALPALVLQGADDSNVTREDFDALVKATESIKGSSSVWIPKCHHLLAIPPSTNVASEVLVPIQNWITKNF